MNIETAVAILYLLALLGVVALYIRCAGELTDLKRELECEIGYRRELQSRLYEMHGELRDGFQRLGLRWKPKEAASWVAVQGGGSGG